MSFLSFSSRDCTCVLQIGLWQFVVVVVVVVVCIGEGQKRGVSAVVGVDGCVGGGQGCRVGELLCVWQIMVFRSEVRCRV